MAELEFRENSIHNQFRRALNKLHLVDKPSSSSRPATGFEVFQATEIGAKLSHKMKEMLLPYNSFFGISSYLRCDSNKEQVFEVKSVL